MPIMYEGIGLALGCCFTLYILYFLFRSGTQVEPAQSNYTKLQGSHIVLQCKPQQGEFFHGVDLKRLFESIFLALNEKGVYQCLSSDVDQTEPICGLVSSEEPGYFPQQMEQKQFSGLLLFARISKTASNRDIQAQLNKIIEITTYLKDSLAGSVWYDQQSLPMSTLTPEHLSTQIFKFAQDHKG